MDSRTRLVEAMSDLMWQKGYAATSPREVREQADVGQGSMYHHFPSKRDLALAALKHNCADLLPGTQRILDAPGDPMEKITAYLSRPLPALKGCKVGRMTQDPLVVADPALLAPVAAAFDAVHQGLASLIEEAIKNNQLPGDLNPQRTAFLMTATIQGGYVLAIAAQDPRPFDEARAGALDLLRTASRTTTTHQKGPQS